MRQRFVDFIAEFDGFVAAGSFSVLVKVVFVLFESFREESQKKSQRAAYFEQQEREFEKILEISKAEGFTAGYKYAMSKRLYAKVREWGPFKEWLEDPNRPKKSA